jgi:hypothetical protein
MFGGAYAASNSSGGGKATASAKAKKGPRGPKGATGPAGPAGPKGDAGAAGSNGTNGGTGADGKSVTGKAVTGGTCGAGVAGVEYTSASGVNTVCNGKNGTNGTNGTNGVDGETGFTETLPSGKTETGAWAVPTENAPIVAALGGIEVASTAISFPIPLASPSGQFKYVPAAGTPPSQCENTEHAGTASAGNPEATKGWLCVYAAFGAVEENGLLANRAAAAGFEEGASTSGSILLAPEPTGTFGYAGGTWAVTAP